MAFRKMKAKKYNGIYEYFNPNDPDKRTTAYYIAYRDIEGKVKKVKCEAKDKDEALEMLNTKKSEIAKTKKDIAKGLVKLEKKIQSNALTLDDLAKEFHAQRTNIQAKQDEAKYHNHISPVLGKLKISKSTREDMLKLKKELSEKEYERPKKIDDPKTGERKSIKEKVKLGPKTVKDVLEYLRVIFNYAIEKKYITINPVVINKITNQAEDNEAGRVLTDDELETLWNIEGLKMNDRLYLFLKTCYFTGARPAGVIDIQVKHIDFNEKKIRIRAMKKGKSYKATVSDELLFLLREWIRKHRLKHDNYIFYPIQSYQRAKTAEEKEAFKNKRSNYAGYQRLIREIIDPVFNVGIDSYDRMYRVTVYTLRRTSGTKIYKKYGIVHAKKFLNHTDIKTTMIYLNIEDDTEVMVDAL